MKDLIFMVADIAMVIAGYRFGWPLIRKYGNYLLGLEWMIVATSGMNFLVWSLLGGPENSPLYDVAYFFDAFSRSVGITLILVLGLMRLTHRYHPALLVEVSAFGLAIAAGLYLQQFRGTELHVVPATFYVVVNLLTTLFLAYFVRRLWAIDRRVAAWTAVVTAAGTVIAVTYDFFPIPGDDANRTLFYIFALSTWAAQLWVYGVAYRVFHAHNVVTGVEPAPQGQKTVLA